jgi:hypothetical protein
MIKSASIGGAALDLLGGRFGGDISSPGVAADDLWCSSMPKNRSAFGLPNGASSCVEPVCGKLRTVYGGVVDEPMPDQLADLANLLEMALERGELFSSTAKRPTR